MKLFYNWRKFTENDIEALFDIYKDEGIIQGLVLFVAAFGTYYYYLINNTGDGNVARSMGLAIIMVSNILLVQVNSSDTEYTYKSIKKLVKDKVMWVSNLGIVLGLGIVLYTPLSSFLKLAPLSFYEMIVVIIISIVSVMWYDCKIIILPI